MIHRPFCWPGLRTALEILYLLYPLPMPDPRFLHRLSDVPAAAWDALHEGRTPFL